MFETEQDKDMFQWNKLEIANKQFYFDDCLMSPLSVAEAVSAQTQLCDLLSKQGFRVRNSCLTAVKSWIKFSM